NNSPSPDGLHRRILKKVAKEITKPMLNIFKKSMQEAELPHTWTKATMTAYPGTTPHHYTLTNSFDS
ncbi:hypothetical protein CAPTEDRAFT_128409, partial [Capitella teleta]